MSGAIKNPSSPAFIQKKKEKTHIQVGLDFGTSTTKVVFSQLGRRQFRALDFQHNLPHYPNYCIPSVCAIGQDGSILMGAKAAQALSDEEWSTGLHRLKVVVAGNYDDSFSDDQTATRFKSYLSEHGKMISPENLTAMFLANVMMKSILKIKKLPEYKQQDIDFAFNICVPIDHVENNQVKTAFENIFVLSEFILKDLLKRTKNAKYSIKPELIAKSKTHKAEKIFLIPEAVASFASYLASLRRKEGLHAVIDFGAGTTDVSICDVLLAQDDPQCYWYAARNIPKGTANIEEIIAKHIHTHDKNSAICTFKDIKNCLDGFSNKQPKKSRIPKEPELIDSIMDELIKLRDSKDYKYTWANAYCQKKRDYLWKDVEIYTCGGGSYLPKIDEVFAKPWWSHLKTTYAVKRLPVPDDYDPGPSDAPFERMSVAYGLAIPQPQHADYRLPKEAPNQTPAPLRVRSIDHEDLYAEK